MFQFERICCTMHAEWSFSVWKFSFPTSLELTSMALCMSDSRFDFQSGLSHPSTGAGSTSDLQYCFFNSTQR